MNILLQTGIIFCLVTAADFISAMIPMQIPVSIIGIILMLLLLASKILKVSHIHDIADFFLKNMAFFFIAAGVSIIGKYQLIEHIWWQFSLIVLFTTLLTFAVTGYAVKYAMKLQNRLRKRANHESDI